MKILFLDDSYYKRKKLLGYGGFLIDDSQIRAISDDLNVLKKSFKIPRYVELKWSPDTTHYLRTKFPKKRGELYREAISVLVTHEAKLLCAVHDLGNCYGLTRYDWSYRRAKLWAAQQQLEFLAERFQQTFLDPEQEYGLIISDEYGSKEGQASLIQEISVDLATGTAFQKLDRISLVPLMTDSEYCPPVQLADLVIGITVSFLGGGRYGEDLFEDLVPLFSFKHRSSSAAVSLYTSAVLGVGLKLFPSVFYTASYSRLKRFDDIYRVSGEKGVYRREG